MKIYSWNVLRSNRKIPEILSYIESLDVDVICLQEVTDRLLNELKKTSLTMVYGVDRYSHPMYYSPRDKIIVNYAVILTKHPVLDSAEIKFPGLLRTFKSATFEFLMELVERWESITNVGAVYADIDFGGKPIRVFCAHLALWNPQTRANEFEHLADYLSKDHPNIVCGDFNILEYGPIKILNWLLSGTFYEGMPWFPERERMEVRFRNRALTNPHFGQITHPFSRSQLDHILISKELTAKHAWVEKNSHGSDHQPIGLEIEL